MNAKNEQIKLMKAEKKKVLPTLYVSDSEGKYGVINRRFFECIMDFEIWSAEPFEDDYLTTFLSKPKLQENAEAIGIWTTIVYRVHFHDEKSRGYSMFEADNRNADGLTVKRIGDREITKEDFETKLKSHKYKVLQEDGGNLVPLKMYVH